MPTRLKVDQVWRDWAAFNALMRKRNEAIAAEFRQAARWTANGYNPEHCELSMNSALTWLYLSEFQRTNKKQLPLTLLFFACWIEDADWMLI